MLAVSQTTVALAACIRGLILSMRINVKVYLIAKASPIAASTSVETYPTMHKTYCSSGTFANVATNQAPESMLCYLPSQATAVATIMLMS